jgi:protein phosphatase
MMFPKLDDERRLIAAAVSEVGRVRQNNQDGYLISMDEKLFIVSDGMGGHNAGELASNAVVTILPRMIKQRIMSLGELHDQIIEEILRKEIQELSHLIREQSIGQPGLQGMGATVALVWIHDGQAYLAHVGDSRIYLFRRNELLQLTEDHSVIALLLKYGEIKPEDVKGHPARGRLSRFIGMEGEVLPDIKTIQLERGDRLLLCTDGLTEMVTDLQIMQSLQSSSGPESICRNLVNAALASGGVDNVTALVVNW